MAPAPIPARKRVLPFPSDARRPRFSCCVSLGEKVAARAAAVVRRAKKEVSMRQRFYSGDDGQPFPVGPSAVVLVSHGDALQMLQCALAGRPVEQHRSLPHLENCGIRVLRPPPPTATPKAAVVAAAAAATVEDVGGAGLDAEGGRKDGRGGGRRDVGGAEGGGLEGGGAGAFKATGARVFRAPGSEGGQAQDGGGDGEGEAKG